MNAGRELDALVAEKVMGWTKVALRDDSSMIYGINPDGKKDIVPCYSADIAAAWEVVEKMRTAGFYAQLWATKAEGGMWPPLSCTLQESAKLPISMAAESMPEAICLAALKAVGVDVER